MKKNITFYMALLSMTAFVSSCTTMPDGTTVPGAPGSAMWNLSTSADEKYRYVEAVCERYGYKRNNSNWAECMQKTASRLGFIPSF